MDLSQQHKQLIEEIIKQNPAFRGHENLIEKFCSEVYKKSYLLLDSVSNIDSLKSYLTKVADTSIANVIKSAPKAEKLRIQLPDLAKPNVANVANVPNKPVKQDEPAKPNVSEKSAALFEPQAIAPQKKSYDIINSLPDVKPAEIKNVTPKKESIPKVVSLRDEFPKNSTPPDYSSLIDPREFFPRKILDVNVPRNMVRALKHAHLENPNKNYMQIFAMRHIQGVHQSAIAHKLKISQSDLSKRYYELVKLIQQELA